MTSHVGLNDITAKGTSAIGFALRDNDTISELNFRTPHIYIYQNLELDGNTVGDEGAAAIGEALKLNRALTVITLGILACRHRGDRGRKDR